MSEQPQHKSTDYERGFQAAREQAAQMAERNIRQMDLPERWSHTDHVLAELAEAIRVMQPEGEP
jgi:SLT domain-containing protein